MTGSLVDYDHPSRQHEYQGYVQGLGQGQGQGQHADKGYISTSDKGYQGPHKSQGQGQGQGQGYEVTHSDKGYDTTKGKVKVWVEVVLGVGRVAVARGR